MFKRRVQIQCFVLVSCLIFIIQTLPAQYISLKSIPVASGDQFLLYPSQKGGMAGVSIATNDVLADPFTNPAKGIRMDGLQFFGSPTYYTITENNGSAKSLPFGLYYNSGSWFGGAAFALQQLSAPEEQVFGPWVDFADARIAAPTWESTLLSEKNAYNVYLSGYAGYQIPGSNLSLGGGVFWADLNAVDGVELLYVNSNRIEQFGHLADFRLGFLNQFPGDKNLELLLLHSRVNMTHDVTYRRWIWDEQAQQSVLLSTIDRNLDKTRTSGLHIGYDQPVAQDNFRLGGIFTVNRKSHPKLPNYELMNIPRDPGTTWAYNFGFGLSHKKGKALFGLDIIYEPIRSNTWADAAADTQSVNGTPIPAGVKTVDNDFEFSNWLLRLGIEHQEKGVGFQFGLQLRLIDYRLDQDNRILETQRTQNESWIEWTPTIGLTLDLPDFQIRYLGRLTTGTGRPGVRSDLVFAVPEAGRSDFDFIPAPSGALTLQDAEVYTHQISVSIPIKK